MSTIPVEGGDNAEISAHENEQHDTQSIARHPLRSATMSRSSSLEGLAPRSSRASTGSQASIRSTQALPPTIRSQRGEDRRSITTESERTDSTHSNNAPVVERDVILDQADAAATHVMRELPPQAARVATVPDDLLKGNFEHNPELKAVIEAGGNPGMFANWQLKTPREQQSAVGRFLLDFANNNFENPMAMKFASVFHMGAKGAFCVMLMTWARQLASNGMSDDAGFTDKMREVTGGLVAALPPMLLTAGGVKDLMDGTASTWSTSGRATLAMAGVATLAVTAALGNLAEAGPALAAFGLAYCLGRDTSQLFIRTPGQMKDIQLKPSIASGVAYGGVEMGVGTAMSYRAPGTSMHADGLRGVFNGAGELMDDIDLTLSHLFKEGMDETEGNALAKLGGGLSRVNNHYRNRLSLQMPTGKEVANMLLSTYPARAALFGIVVMAGTNFGVKTPNLDPAQENNYGNLLTALILGTLYSAFAGMFAKKTPGAGGGEDLEAQNEHELRETPATAYRSAQTPQGSTAFIEEINVDEQREVPISVGTRTDDTTPTGTVRATGVHGATLSTEPASAVLHRAPSQLQRASQESEAVGTRPSTADMRANTNPHPNSNSNANE